MAAACVVAAAPNVKIPRRVGARRTHAILRAVDGAQHTIQVDVNASGQQTTVIRHHEHIQPRDDRITDALARVGGPVLLHETQTISPGVVARDVAEHPTDIDGVRVIALRDGNATGRTGVEHADIRSRTRAKVHRPGWRPQVHITDCRRARRVQRAYT